MVFDDMRTWKNFGGNVGQHCRNCEERYVGCHSTCEKYLEAKEAFESRKNSIIEAKEVDRAYKGYQKKHYERKRKGLNKKRSN